LLRHKIIRIIVLFVLILLLVLIVVLVLIILVILIVFILLLTFILLFVLLFYYIYACNFPSQKIESDLVFGINRLGISRIVNKDTLNHKLLCIYLLRVKVTA